jgi:hypothetical protein
MAAANVSPSEPRLRQTYGAAGIESVAAQLGQRITSPYTSATIQ